MRETGIERMMRDARINRIVEGATEVMSAFVALAGVKRHIPSTARDYAAALESSKLKVQHHASRNYRAPCNFEIPSTRLSLTRSSSHAPNNQSPHTPTINGENHLPYRPSGENFSVAA